MKPTDEEPIPLTEAEEGALKSIFERSLIRRAQEAALAELQELSIPPDEKSN